MAFPIKTDDSSGEHVVLSVEYEYLSWPMMIHGWVNMQQSIYELVTSFYGTKIFYLNGNI